jgi:GntR family transcriptional regulator, transcriptional repressor for pyruvate dehydrogenase complex
MMSERLETPIYPVARAPSGKSAAIARDLASLVVSATLTPGTLLPTENELTQSHAASRPIVREAIRLLGGAGLVETRHGVGSIVNPPRLWNVFDPIVLAAHLDNRNLPAIVGELLDLRRTVEVESVGMAARRITPSELASLRASVDRMGAHLDDPERTAHADFAFHETIIEAAGNRFFDGILRYVRAALWEGRQLTSHGGGLRGRTQAFEHHRAILAAVEARDPERARAAMEEHLAVAASDLRRVVLASGLDPADASPGESDAAEVAA